MLEWKKKFVTGLKNSLTAVGGIDQINERVKYRGPKIPNIQPLLTYFVVSDISALETGPQDLRVQVDIWCEDMEQSENIRQAIRDEFHDQPFAIVGATHNFLKEINERELPLDEDTKLLHWIVEYRSIFYREV